LNDSWVSVCSFRVLRLSGFESPLQAALTQSDPHEVSCHFRVSEPIEVPPYWLGDPASYFAPSIKMVLYLTVFLSTSSPPDRGLAAPLMWLCPLQGTTRLARRRPISCRSRKRVQQLLSWSFSPLRRLARASLLHPGLPHRVRSAHRVSHPLDGLLLARTPGPVSYRYRPWGSLHPPGGFPHRWVPLARHLRNYPLGVLPLLLHAFHRNESRFLTTALPPHGIHRDLVASPPTGCCSSSESVLRVR
jgi:hypothetical protein